MEEYEEVSANYTNHAFPSQFLCVNCETINYRIPTVTKCVDAAVNISGTMAEFFAIKTNKYVTLVDNQDIIFDVHGVWLEQSVIKGLFEKAPMFMKDYHEDEEEDYDEGEEC